MFTWLILANFISTGLASTEIPVHIQRSQGPPHYMTNSGQSAWLHEGCFLGIVFPVLFTSFFFLRGKGFHSAQRQCHLQNDRCDIWTASCDIKKRWQSADSGQPFPQRSRLHAAVSEANAPHLLSMLHLSHDVQSMSPSPLVYVVVLDKLYASEAVSWT